MEHAVSQTCSLYSDTIDWSRYKNALVSSVPVAGGSFSVVSSNEGLWHSSGQPLAVWNLNQV